MFEYLFSQEYANECRYWEGFREGIEEAKEDTARRMLAEGLSVEFIKKYTKLSEDRLKALTESTSSRRT